MRQARRKLSVEFKARERSGRDLGMMKEMDKEHMDNP
jgi:hypothetical protein